VFVSWLAFLALSSVKHLYERPVYFTTNASSSIAYAYKTKATAARCVNYDCKVRCVQRSFAIIKYDRNTFITQATV